MLSKELERLERECLKKDQQIIELKSSALSTKELRVSLALYRWKWKNYIELCTFMKAGRRNKKIRSLNLGT